MVPESVTTRVVCYYTPVFTMNKLRVRVPMMILYILGMREMFSSIMFSWSFLFV
jgi:hypothetical protein